jgi:hypothetical protein
MEQSKLKFKTLKKRKTKLKLKKNTDFKKNETTVVDYGDNIVTYTWCECGENHHGNQQIGQIADPGQGFMRADLVAAKTFAEENYNCDTEMFNLKKVGLINDAGEPLIIKNKINEIVDVNSAHFLIIRGFIPAILNKYKFSMNDLMKEVMGQKWDNKYWDTRRQKVLNKHARENNVVSGKAQTANYAEGKGTIHAFENMTIMDILKKEFMKIGEKFNFACAEGNKYMDGGKKKNGIGWHGDSERRRVLSMRLGLNPSMPFYYRWKYKHKEIGQIMKWDINAGDVMVMSEWAVGTEWKKSSLVTLVHATGANKYVKPKSDN